MQCSLLQSQGPAAVRGGGVSVARSPRSELTLGESSVPPPPNEETAEEKCFKSVLGKPVQQVPFRASLLVEIQCVLSCSPSQREAHGAGGAACKARRQRSSEGSGDPKRERTLR